MIPLKGTRENPHTISPPDWNEGGLPYGHFCKCSVCGLIERSTSIFDYYADEPNQPLKCETCQTGIPLSMVKPALDLLEEEGQFDDPYEDDPVDPELADKLILLYKRPLWEKLLAPNTKIVTHFQPLTAEEKAIAQELFDSEYLGGWKE